MKTNIIYKITRIKMIILLCCALLFYASTVVFLITVYPNLYKKWSVEEITVNGEASPNSAVYSFGKGQYLIRLNTNLHSRSIYTIDFNRKIVSNRQGDADGLYFFAGYFYCFHGGFRMIALNGTMAKTDFFDAKLALKDRYCEFTTPYGEQIRINYRLNKPME